MSAYDSAIEQRLSWRERAHGHLALARISNSPTILSNVLAGAALAGAEALDARIAGLVLALFLFYTAGMYLNDICDFAVDCRERPERPLPSGVVSRTTAIGVMIALFAIGSGILIIINRASFLSGLVLIGLIVLYDVWHKTNPLSPVVMGACRLMVYVTAFLAFATAISSEILFAGGLLLLYILGLTYIAKSETRPSFTNYWPAALLFLPVVYFALRVPPYLILPLLVIFAGWTAHSISFVYRSDGRSIGGAIGRLIAGIALYDAVVLADAGSVVGVGLALVAFAATLFFQRYIRGT